LVVVDQNNRKDTYKIDYTEDYISKISVTGPVAGRLVQRTFQFEYENGLLVRLIESATSVGGVVFEHVIDEHSTRQPTEILVLDHRDGTSKLMKYYIFSNYDAKGNWLVREEYSADDVLQNTIRREFEYYN
jgi:hypothetical protein